MWGDWKGQKEFTVDSIVDTSNQNGTEERG